MKDKILHYYSNLDLKYLDRDKKRFDWVDVCKGILIMAVVFGHASAKVSPYVYLYHIPMFFFLSGYVEKLDEKSLLHIVVQKFLSLFVPFVVVNVFFFAIRIGLNVFGIQGLFYDTVLQKEQLGLIITYVLKMQWMADVAGATWYLACLYITFILAKMIVIITKNKVSIITVIIAFIVYSIGMLLNELEISLPYFIGLSFVAVFYVILGNYIKKRHILDNFTYINLKCWGVIFVLYSYVFSQKLYAAVDWAGGKFGNPFFSIITVIFAIIILMNISKSLLNTRLGEGFSFLGKQSLAIMMLHFVCFKIIYILLVLLDLYPVDILKNVIPPNNDLRGCLYGFGSVVLFLIIHWCFNKFPPYQWFFQGKIRTPKWVKDERLGNLSTAFFVILAILFMQIIPFSTIVDKIDKLKMPYQIEGVYGDYFVGPEMTISINTKTYSVVEMEFYNPFNENTCEIYVDEVLQNIYEINKSTVKIEIPINEIGIHNIKIVFEKTYIPKEISASEDIRELTVLLVDGEVEIR